MTSKVSFDSGLKFELVCLFVDLNRFQNDPKAVNMEPDDFAAVGG